LSANVVGEIRGSRNPEQIVVVGGHLDSWDLASGSTDNGCGVPGIGLRQDSSEYQYTHHSPGDTFDKVQPDVLSRNTTIMALPAFWIADRPEGLAAPWPPEKTAHMLVEKHDDVMLKLFGLWPFGELGGKRAPVTGSF
jgi:hypothetical protein